MATKKQLYYEGVKRAGMDGWVLKAVHKIGKAGHAKKSHSVTLTPGRVTQYLISTRLVMKDHQGKYMLTADGQVVYGQIKFHQVKVAAAKPSKAVKKR